MTGLDGDDILLAFYGDDFTGSTDAMEALTVSGYRTVLFLEAPTPEILRWFKGIRCIGVAGKSRSQSPQEMEQALGSVFEKLMRLNAPIVHYKICSTFNSSPEKGSIGKAIEVARDYFQDQQAIPLLVGVPALGRYTLFGQHYARMNREVYRLDRHPTMSRHPITPMREADLRIHLGGQTSEEIDLVNILELDGDPGEVRERYKRKASEGHKVLLIDVLDEARLELSGRLVWESAMRLQHAGRAWGCRPAAATFRINPSRFDPPSKYLSSPAALPRLRRRRLKRRCRKAS
jgi:uncharacterized protein YgbK (DUF1537 family)